MHDVAGVKERETPSAADRRLDRGVTEIGLRIVDGGVVALHLRSQLIDQRLLGIEILLGLELLFRELLKSLQVQLVVPQVGLVLGLLRHRLLESRGKGALVDLQKRIALLHHLTLLEEHLRDLTVDTALDRYRPEWRDDSETVGVHGKVGPLHLERGYGNLYRCLTGSTLRGRSDGLHASEELIPQAVGASSYRKDSKQRNAKLRSPCQIDNPLTDFTCLQVNRLIAGETAAWN